jgi:hypothetical protein
VDCTILLAAGAAVLKFHIYNLFGYRWKSEVKAEHFSMPDGSVILSADYIVSNTGQRPLKFSKVSIRIHGIKQEGSLIVRYDSTVLAERIILSTDSGVKGNFEIEAGERTIFTVRTLQKTLPQAIFVFCQFESMIRRTPAIYQSFYSPYGTANQIAAEPAAEITTN